MEPINQPEESNNHTNRSETNATRFKALVRASGVAIGIDLFLILLKYLLARVTGSPVLLADALHSGGDLAVSLTVLISIAVHYGFKDNRWVKEVEGIVALLISIALIAGSIEVLRSVVRNEATTFRLSRGIPLVIAIAGISIALVLTFTMFRFKRRVGKQYDSIAFIAEGMHTRSDFFTSLGVWVTLGLGYFGIHIERMMTLLVGLAVLRIGIELFFHVQFFHEVQSLIIMPGFLSLVKKLTPAPLKEYIHNICQTVGQRCRTFIAQIPQIVFFWEDWALNHKNQLITGNILLIILLYIGTGFYTVLPYETGLELFFGKVVEKNPPGWHIHIPKPFGKVVRVDTGVTARIESGFRTQWYFQGEEPEAYLWEYTHVEGRYHKVPEEAIAITGDENVIDVNFLCYYRIIDPVQYAFNTENTHEILRNLFCHEVHAELGRYQIDRLLTADRGNVQIELLQKMRRIVEELPLGVQILNVYMREAHPPIEVVPGYRAVASARERKIEIVHTANTYANEVLPRSRGQGEAEILQAEADAFEKVYTARGNMKIFQLKQDTFRRTQPVQQVRLWWEAVEQVLREKTIYILPNDAERRMYNSRFTPPGEFGEMYKPGEEDTGPKELGQRNQKLFGQ